MTTTERAPAFDARAFRRVLGTFPTGVAVITTATSSGPVGMAVSSFTSVSLEPPLVAFLPGRGSRSWEAIRQAGAFCVNILGQDQGDLCARFARSGDDKFAGVSWQPAPSGAPVLDGVIAWIDCELVQTFESGDHDIAVGQVRQLESPEGAEAPLVFFKGGYPSLQLGAASPGGGGRAAPVEGDTADHLVHEILGDYLETSRSRCSGIVAVSTGRAAVEGLLGVAFDVMRESRAAIVILRNEGATLAGRREFAYLRELQRDVRAMWLSALRRAIEDGEFDDDLDAELAYSLVMDVIYAAARWWASAGDAADRDAETRARAYQRLILTGLLGRSPA